MEKVSGGQVAPTLLAGIYGQSKMRKTTTALCAPLSLRPMAVLDCDRGAKLRLAVLGATPEQREAMGVVEVMPPECGPWMKEGIDFYYPGKNYFEDCFVFATRQAKDYKLVVVDTVTRMAEKFLDEARQTPYINVKDGGKRVTMKSGAVETTHPTQSDFGVAQDRTQAVIQGLDEAPCHVLLLFHEKTGEISESETVKRIVAGPRTVGVAQIEVIPSLLDLVMRLAAEPQGVGKAAKVKARTMNHNFYIAGDRSGLFADNQEHDPIQFWSKIKGLIEMGGGHLQSERE